MYVLSAGADVDARWITTLLSHLLPLPTSCRYLLLPRYLTPPSKNRTCVVSLRGNGEKEIDLSPDPGYTAQGNGTGSRPMHLSFHYCTYSMYMQSGGRGCVGTIERAVSGIASGDGQTGRLTDSVVSCRAF